ncbi:MAG: serine/threonine protein kinase, partial [Planctomycetota bacterium]
MSAPTERLARLGEEAEALLAARRPVPVRELAQRHGVDEKVARDCVEALRVLTQAADPGEQAPSHGRCGPYELRGELGRGGMGVVYRAWHPELKRDVALKLLHVSARPSDTRVQRFVLEAQATARLRHPGVVGIHHAGWEAGRPYLVMDLVRGESLSVLLRRSGPLEPRRAAAVCRDVALVLEHVHRAGFLHRDVKPSNILVDADGRVLLTDFGLAKELDSERKLTLTGMIVGTPQYMPPEQISGEPLDARTDVYSLGVTLYTLLSGEPPFSGLSQFDLFTAICRAEPPPISSSRPDVPAALEAIALQCMAKDPEQRYPTARALADDLERWLEGESVVARPFRDRKRHRLWALLCAGLLCAGLLCAAALLAPTTPRPPS